VTRTPADTFTRSTGLRARELLSRLEQAACDDGELETQDPEANQLRLEIAGHRFTIRNTADGSPPHALRRLFDGEVVEQPDGSVVRGRFRLHALTRVALTLWFASMSLIAILLVAGNLTGGVELPVAASGWAGMSVPVVILGAAAWLVRSSLAQSRKLEEEIARFLMRLVSS
jgi:hypothetical protein